MQNDVEKKWLCNLFKIFYEVHLLLSLLIVQKGGHKPLLVGEISFCANLKWA
jgi:hypothetical protein